MLMQFNLWKTSFFVLLFFHLVCYTCQAQTKLPIKKQLVIQDAFDQTTLFGTRLVIDALNRYKQPVSSDTLGGTVNIRASFNQGQFYRIRVYKKKYHTKDTILKIDHQATKLYLALYPKQCTYLSATIKDQYSQQAVALGKVEVQNQQDSTAKQVVFLRGNFDFCGTCKQAYKLLITAPNYIPEQVNLQVNSSNCFEKNPADQFVAVYLTPDYGAQLLTGSPVLLPALQFINDGLELGMEAGKEIKRMAKWMNAFPDKLLTITFMAAYYSQRPFNRRLAERRARVIERKLINQGIGSHRFILKCQGWVDRSLLGYNRNQQVYLKILKS